MTLKQTLAALQKAGTAQNRKIYGRHGVAGAQYGVSFAEIKRLRKAIGTDHELACGLWATGNHDARVLATMVADPAAMTSRDLDAWARDLDSYVITDAFGGLVQRGPHARRKFEAWKNRRDEWRAACAWNLLAGLAQRPENELDAGWLREQLALITDGIHERPNRVRHSMNQALICIGTRGPALRRSAEAAARRIGKVEVDHGQTSCQTPDAIAYIEKVVAHREQQEARAAAKKARR